MLKHFRSICLAALVTLPSGAMAGGVITEGYSTSPSTSSVQKTAKSQEQQVYLFAAALLNGHSKAVDDDSDPTGNPGTVVANIIDEPEAGPQVGCAQAGLPSLLFVILPALLGALRRPRARRCQ